jgi:uncharacterized membrane protein
MSNPLPDTRAFSADGSIWVGADASDQAARCAGGAVIPLGSLPGGNSASVALDVSADGSVIVGKATASGADFAFIWDEARGMRRLDGILTAQGVDLGDWQLHEVVAVSADGRVVAGNGTNPEGIAEGWVAELDAANLPGLGHGAAALLATLLAALGIGLGARGRATSGSLRSSRSPGR